MGPRRLHRRRATLLGLILLGLTAPSARAQTCGSNFGPVGPEFRPAQSITYNQLWPIPARGPSSWAFTWNEGQDVWARLFDLELLPTGPQFRVNTGLDLDIQDEPHIAWSTLGVFLIAWSDRGGYDGEEMGIFGRAYDSLGNPYPAVQINQIWQASQWRPLIAPRPLGGYCVAWSGNWDGDAYFRLLGPTGLPLGNEIRINTFLFDAQVDPAPAVAPNGTMFFAFIDYSAFGSVGTGTNIWARMYDTNSQPLQPLEFLVTSWSSNGEQRDPRVVADSAGRFTVVWESQQVDGSGYGIMARRYDLMGLPLGPEFLVNTTTAGDQRSARITLDGAGNFLVAWEDGSMGALNTTIRARRYDAAGNALGPDFLVNEVPVTGAILPAPAMDPAGTHVVIAFEAPGTPGNDQDVYAREFVLNSGPASYCTAKVNSQGCTPAIGFTGVPSASSALPFRITAGNVLNQKFGLMFYGYDSSFVPFQGVTACIAPPLRRTAVQTTGGSPGPTDCSGTMSFEFNAHIQGGADANLVTGETVSARYFYRDPQDPAGYGTGLTDALRFTICP